MEDTALAKGRKRGPKRVCSSHVWFGAEVHMLRSQPPGPQRARSLQGSSSANEVAQVGPAPVAWGLRKEGIFGCGHGHTRARGQR